MEEIFDLIIVGLGPAGIRAANIAIKNGLSVLAFEKENVGGCCLNKGCVPTKSFLHTSGAYFEALNSNKNGVFIDGEIKPDILKMVEIKNSIIAKLSKAAENELNKKGVKIIKEEAKVDFENLEANGYKAKNIIIATGSIPFELCDFRFNQKDILSSDDILNLEELPKNIAIIGTGAIGVEWARIFSNLGVNVSVIEKAPNILPLMDVDIQKRITRIFKQKKIKIYTGKTATFYKEGKLTLDDNTEIDADILLVAVGRKRIIPDGLKINSDLTTNYKNVYATGDISATKQLAHTATMQADFVMNKILGKKAKLTDDNLIPSVIYGTPEAASIGINEQDIENLDDYKIYNLPISFLAKSWCDNQIDGFIKIITKDDLIKGAHIVSNEASSLISQIQIMMLANYKVSNIKDIVFAHPTYSEGIMEAILNG